MVCCSGGGTDESTGTNDKSPDELIRWLEVEVKTRLSLLDQKLDHVSGQMRRCIVGIEDLQWTRDLEPMEMPIPCVSQPHQRRTNGKRTRIITKPGEGEENNGENRGIQQMSVKKKSRSWSFNSNDGNRPRISSKDTNTSDQVPPSRGFIGSSFDEIANAPDGDTPEEEYGSSNLGNPKWKNIADNDNSRWRHNRDNASSQYQDSDNGIFIEDEVTNLRGGAHKSIQLPMPSGDGNGGIGGHGRDSNETIHSNASSGSVPLRLSSWIINRQRRQGVTSELIWNFLEEPESSVPAFWFSRLFPFLILITLFVTLLQTLEGSPMSAMNFMYIEAGIESLFTLEILVRLFVCPNRWMFFLSAYNIIDIISVLPLALRILMILGVLDGLQEQAQRNVWHVIFWGVVPVLRLLKVLRRFQQVQLLAKAFRLSFEALPVLLFIYFLQLLIFTACLFCVEESEMVGTLPEAMWLMFVSMTTVGYGDAYPITPLGKYFSAMGIICAALYMAIPLGIIGSCFSEVWMDRDRILLVHRLRSRLVQWGYRARDIPKLFSHFDLDRNGLLDLTEFRRMVQLLKLGLRDERIVGLFEAFDGDGSGAIDDKEFVKSLFPAHYHELYDGDGELRQWVSPQNSLAISLSWNVGRIQTMLQTTRHSLISRISGQSHDEDSEQHQSESQDVH